MLGLREVPGQCLASRESLSISVPRLLVVPIDYGNANGRRRGEHVLCGWKVPGSHPCVSPQRFSSGRPRGRPCSAIVESWNSWILPADSPSTFRERFSSNRCAKYFETPESCRRYWARWAHWDDSVSEGTGQPLSGASVYQGSIPRTRQATGDQGWHYSLSLALGLGLSQHLPLEALT